MSVVNLLFEKTLGSVDPRAANLRFGFSEAVAIEARALSIAIIKAKPSLSFNTNYSTNVVRLITCEPDLVWDKANLSSKISEPAWQLSATLRSSKATLWGTAEALGKAVNASIAQLPATRTSLGIKWATGARIAAAGALLGVRNLVTTRRSTLNAWQSANKVSVNSSDSYKILSPLKVNKDSAWQYGRLVTAGRLSHFARAIFTAKHTSIKWQIGQSPRAGKTPLTPLTPLEPTYISSTLLKFQCKWNEVSPLSVNLNFGLYPCAEAGGQVISRKVYFIVNSLNIKRVSDNIPIQFNSVSVGIDKDSWCWSFSGSIPYMEFEKVEPSASGPVEIEVEINGILWRVLVEKYGKKEVFAKTDIQVTGRSVTAYLENPYAPVRSFSQSTTIQSRQFAENELTRAGLITGFSLDWQLIDPLGWLMPANTWSYNDLTPVQVIQNIVQGAGGFINSHPSQKQLIAMPDYPAPFWEWDSMNPNKVIPESLIKARSLDWNEKPAYNGVYVSGENTGVTAFVKRTGTAGEFQAPMYVNPMISHSSAARNKGISLLSAGGKQARVGLDLPMESSLGLVTPGMLIQVVPGANGPSWKGLVRGTNISAAWSQGLTINQSIDLERHYGGL